MGYYSEVAYGIEVDDIKWNDRATEEDKKNLNADGIFLLMLTEMQSDPIAGKCFDDTYEINVHLTVNKERRTILFAESGLKWYDDYEDVKAHERLYELMVEYAELYGNREDMINPVSCAYVRIGEEDDDIEERGAGYDQYSIMSTYRGVDIHI